jgi:hypothetical protein
VVEETGVPGENQRPFPSNWQTLSYAYVLRHIDFVCLYTYEF